MNFLFGKKQTATAMAEVIEDGQVKSNEEMKKAKYNHYDGAQPAADQKRMIKSV